MKDYVVLIGAIIGAIGGLITIALKVTEIIESPILIYVIVVGYLLFGGGIVWFAFTKTDTGMGLRLSSLLFLCLVTIPLFYWIGGWTEPAPQHIVNPCEEFGITIIEPPNGYVLVNGEVMIRGTLTKKPPDNSIQLIVVSGGQYWATGWNHMEVTATSWRSRTFGTGPYTVMIAYVGPNGRILLDYFQKAGEIHEDYPGIDMLPDDVIECGSAAVS
jgi:hypothetical protein